MRWKLTTSTVTGRAHTDRGETGQDYNKAGTIRIGDVEFFIGLAADGAGSTTEGGRGAEIACETVYEKIVATLRTAGGLSDITDENIRGWITAGRDAIDTEAAAKTKRLKDYACTILGAVAGERGALFFQIGDGAIVTGSGQEYRTIFWPEQGEYANTTFFVTDEQYLHRLQILHAESVPEEIALFTDGLQNLVLSFSDRQAHPGFFRPLFEALNRSSGNAFLGFSAEIETFLGRDEINARSDDDKTLILAVRVQD
ncbi:MAG: protein phosphatase 2C domain-containing protein [Methanoregula sp.]|nr:protein phosphatase 2C domain-containing protein [Methanoregula sp.]